MNDSYVLDACSIIAYLKDETGADRVENLLKEAKSNRIELFINIINVLEIYYCRDDGIETAEESLEKIKKMPLKFTNMITEDMLREAGKLKAGYRISLADSIALAEANVRGVQLVTADHHEFDIIEQENQGKFFWIR